MYKIDHWSFQTKQLIRPSLKSHDQNFSNIDNFQSIFNVFSEYSEINKYNQTRNQIIIRKIIIKKSKRLSRSERLL